MVVKQNDHRVLFAGLGLTVVQNGHGIEVLDDSRLMCRIDSPLSDLGKVTVHSPNGSSVECLIGAGGVVVAEAVAG